MKTALLFFTLLIMVTNANAQGNKAELYDLIAKLIPTNQDNGDVGDWSVSKPNAFGITWQDDGIKMSDDLKINFYRRGTVSLAANGTTAKWKVMLKGARSGYSSFSITSPLLSNIHSPIKPEDLLGKHDYVAQVAQKCHDGAATGFDYYRVTIPKKGMEWMKISWNCTGTACSITIDCYSDFSKQYAELQCR